MPCQQGMAAVRALFLVAALAVSRESTADYCDRDDAGAQAHACCQQRAPMLRAEGLYHFGGLLEFAELRPLHTLCQVVANRDSSTINLPVGESCRIRHGFAGYESPIEPPSSRLCMVIASRAFQHASPEMRGAPGPKPRGSFAVGPCRSGRQAARAVQVNGEDPDPKPERPLPPEARVGPRRCQQRERPPPGRM